MAREDLRDCAVRCVSPKITFPMRCMCTAICALAAEVHCDVSHDAGITATVMPRCGELCEQSFFF